MKTCFLVVLTPHNLVSDLFLLGLSQALSLAIERSHLLLLVLLVGLPLLSADEADVSDLK